MSYIWNVPVAASAALFALIHAPATVPTKSIWHASPANIKRSTSAPALLLDDLSQEARR